MLMLFLGGGNVFSQIDQNDAYRSISVDGRERQYILYVPEGSKTRPLPLIVVLHGGMGSGRQMQRLGFNPYANRYGFAVVYPDAYGAGGWPPGRWNDGRNTDPNNVNTDDVHFIRAMVDDISQRISLDKSRIYVTGPSNGGMMTFRLALEAQDLFAAAAPVSANIPVPISNTSAAAISILTINGTDDRLMPFQGGEVCQSVSSRLCDKGQVISHQQSIQVFAQADGCAPDPHSENLQPLVQDGTWIEKDTFQGCRNGYEVVSYIVHGGGHAWPPVRGRRAMVSGTSSGNLDATKEIVEFFLRQKKDY